MVPNKVFCAFRGSEVVVTAFFIGGRIVHDGGDSTSFGNLTRIVLFDGSTAGSKLADLCLTRESSLFFDRVSVDPAAFRVRLFLKLRCLIGDKDPFVDMKGEIEPGVDSQNLDELVVLWKTLQIGDTEISTRPRWDRIGDFQGVEKDVGVAPIANALGWKFDPLGGLGDNPLRDLRIRFTRAGGDETPYTPVFERDIFLDRTGQEVPGLFGVSLASGEVTSSGLDYVVGRPARMALIQMRPMWWSDSESGHDVPGIPAGAEAWLVALTGVPALSAVRPWNSKVVDPYLRAIETVQDFDAASAMPRITPPESTPASPWLFVYDLADTAPASTANLTSSTFDHVEAKVSQPDPSVYLANRLLRPEPRTNERVFLAARLPMLVDLSDRPVEFLASSDRSPFDGQFLQLDRAATGIEFEVTQLLPVAPEEAPDLHEVRVGALDLALVTREATKEAKPELDRSLFAARFRGEEWQSRPPSLPTVCIEAVLAVSRFTPGGQDPLPGDEVVPFRFGGCRGAGNESDSEDIEQKIEAGFQREAPLVFTLRPPDRAWDGSVPYTVRIEERTADDFNRSLRLRIAQRPESRPAEGGPVVIVDRHPLWIGIVEVPAFRETSSLDDFQGIAVYTPGRAEGQSWEVVGHDEGFRIWMPPQGVGEEMEKVEGGQDLGPDETADFRFSPASRLHLQPTIFDQRFAEAPWNLRRLFGYPGQRDPGVDIVRLDFELLYGMSCTVDRSFLRLAEVSARLGSIQARQSEALLWTGVSRDDAGKFNPTLRAAYRGFRVRWSALHRRFLSRVSVLEPWEFVRPDRLALESGVSYRLRDTAKLRWPVVGRVPAPGENDSPPYAPEDGLAGGFAWAFESENIYRAVWRDPDSTDGKISDLRLSSLGGWGSQKASFDHNRTTIEANVSMGRASFLSLERIGRVGCLYNRAKHVIVYERTVARTRQFQNEQDPHKGRPILRKVREYVEILEPARSYPDASAPQVSPVARGFVRGSEFKSKIIPVTSRWGRDVGKIGWEVPLWNPTADPVVYPKPQIVLDCAAADGPGEVCVEIEEPEKLVFFTSTEPDLDDRTDRWPAAPGVDFADVPPSRPPNDVPIDRARLDGDLPAAAAVEAAHGRFTYAVGLSERAVNLMAERTAQALGAKIRSLNLERGRPIPGLHKVAGVLEKVSSLRDGLDPVLRKIAEKLPTTGTLEAALRQRLLGLVDEFKDQPIYTEVKSAFEFVEGELGNLPYPDKTALCTALTQRTGAILEAGRKRIEDLIQDLRAELLGEIRGLGDILDEEGFEDFKKQAKAVVATEFRRLVTLPSNLNEGLGDVATVIQDVRRSIEGFRSDAHEAIRSLDETIEQAIARGKAVLRDRLLALRGVLLAALRDLETKAVALAYDLFGQAAALVRTHAEGISDHIAAKITEALNMLAATVSLEAAVSEVRKDLGELRDGIVTRVDTLLGAITTALGTVETDLEDVRNELEGIRQKIDSWEGDFTQAIDDLSPDKTLDFYVSEIDTVLQNSINDLVNEELEDGIEAAKTFASDEVCELLWDEATEIREALRSALGDANGFLADLRAKIQNLTDVDDLRTGIERVGSKVRDALEPYAERAREILTGPNVDPIFRDIGDNGLRLLRAYGDPPVVPMLDFNRSRVSYYFDELKNSVDLTPATALVNRVGDQLKALGMRVPTRELLDKVIPDRLTDFDLSEILPDFAGLKLDALFSGLKMPSASSDRVKVTHGFDRQSLRAWLQAEVDLPIAGTITVLSFGPVTVRLREAHFFAVARIEGGAGSSPTQSVSGRITGNWEITVGGLDLVTFVQTSLRFDDSGRIRFDITPEKVDLSGVLKFIADLLETAGSSDEGFSIRLVEERGLPVGVESLLNLPLPSLQFGAFGITNLQLGAFFRLVAVPEFTLGTGLNVGRKLAPFRLSVAFLTGGGWVDTRVSYAPFSGRLISTVSIGIVAGAALEFSLGPIRGGVYVLFGIEVEFRAERGVGNSLTIVLMILLGGEVRVFGFVSVSIQLLLEAEYRDDGSLIGRGTLSLKVKICWCFTFKIKKTVEYTFREGSGQQSIAPDSAPAGPGPRAVGAPAAVPLDEPTTEPSTVEEPVAGPPWISENLVVDDPYDEAADAYLSLFETPEMS